MNKCFSFTRKALLVALVSALDVASHAAPQTGTMTDTRDGKKYKTVQIGEQVWMAENLNYKTKESYCSLGVESNCSKYGRLYKWNATKRACPGGWRLPSKENFETLLESVGGKQVAGKSLKSKKGWEENGNGTDDFGFSALPAGQRGNTGDYNTDVNIFGHATYFWSSTKYNSGSAYFMGLTNDYSNADLDYYGKDIGFSVRCVKD